MHSPAGHFLISALCERDDPLGVTIVTKPAKWLLMRKVCWWGVWLLVTFRFLPSPLASKLRAAPRKGGQSVSLSLSVNSLSTASPMQCLLVASGVTVCCEAPTLNLQGRFLYNPMVEQVEEEETPNSCESRLCFTRLM